MIAAAGVAVSKVIPLKLPVVAYVSIIGLLAACPISRAESLSLKRPERSILLHRSQWWGHMRESPSVIRSALSLKQGWKMILIGVFVMTGTFIGSAVIAQVVMMITGTI